MAAKKGNPGSWARRQLTPLQRFLSYCRFEPETGCVLWVGAQTMGRGHHVPYGAFWFEGKKWYAHRWAAKHIKGLDIDDLQVDHCCPEIVLPTPNTLCVEHVQCLTLGQNRELQHVRQHEARKRAIHLEVGLIRYEDIYPVFEVPEDLIPFFSPPAWLGAQHEVRSDCPF